MTLVTLPRARALKLTPEAAPDPAKGDADCADRQYLGQGHPGAKERRYVQSLLGWRYADRPAKTPAATVPRNSPAVRARARSAATFQRTAGDIPQGSTATPAAPRVTTAPTGGPQHPAGRRRPHRRAKTGSIARTEMNRARRRPAARQNIPPAIPANSAESMNARRLDGDGIKSDRAGRDPPRPRTSDHRPAPGPTLPNR